MLRVLRGERPPAFDHSLVPSPTAGRDIRETARAIRRSWPGIDWKCLNGWEWEEVSPKGVAHDNGNNEVHRRVKRIVEKAARRAAKRVFFARTAIRSLRAMKWSSVLLRVYRHACITKKACRQLVAKCFDPSQDLRPVQRRKRNMEIGLAAKIIFELVTHWNTTVAAADARQTIRRNRSRMSKRLSAFIEAVSTN